MRLVITEKPSVANSIADVLGANERKDGYREGNGYIVSWCVGHLVELAKPQDYDSVYEKWNYDNLPILPDPWRYVVKNDTKKQFEIVKNLMNDSGISEVVEATDAGREGELIFRLTYLMSGCQKPILRLWISSMEESAIRAGFENLRPGEEYQNLYDSAVARQCADWLVGINGTRLFTVLYKNKILKVGRVQTPTLAMITDREIEILQFKKTPYYVVELQLDGVKTVSEKMDDKTKADILAEQCKGADAVVESIAEEEKNIHPPKLYDLTSLQRDANKLFGFTAKQTLEYTQSLYEKKLVTYPRTDSRYLSEDMEDTAQGVIAAIKDVMPFITPFEGEMHADVKKVLNSSKVTDHHAIIPTVQIKKGMETITEPEKKILYLIANRLLCATGKKHVYLAKTVSILCENETFMITGKEIKENGWKFFEDMFKDYWKLTKAATDTDAGTSEFCEDISHVFIEGEILKAEDVQVREKFTKAPSRYTEASLLSAMEKAGANDMDDEVERKGLGTPATRADIIEKLVKDGYVKREKKNMVPTEDGMNLINILPESVKSPQLTADWENELVRVSKGEIKKDSFLDGIQAMVEQLIADYNGVSENPFSKSSSLGICPKCGKDVVSGKFGAYCSGKCGMTFGKALGAKLGAKEICLLLEGKKILVKGLKNKSGKVYDAYLSPSGIQEYSFTGKDGVVKKGYQFIFDISFPKNKKKQYSKED